ncbi:transposase [Methylobacterium sp. Leaf113]|nr:transposase [Methylobacterium sp. Leaf113]
MPSALSADLRERVVVAIEAGASRREAAKRFKVSPASAVRWHETFVREGRTRAKPMGGDQRSHAIEAQADLIRQTYEAKPELFLRELRARLAEHGLRVGVSSLSRFFKRHGITRKKTPVTPPSRIGRT